MQRPVLSNVSNNREMISTFLGYNHRVVQQAGEFFNTENITLDDYPMLSNRAPMNRYKYPEFDGEVVGEIYTLDGDERVYNRMSIVNSAFQVHKYGKAGDEIGSSLEPKIVVWRVMTIRYFIRFKAALKEKISVRLGPDGSDPYGFDDAVSYVGFEAALYGDVCIHIGSDEHTFDNGVFFALGKNVKMETETDKVLVVDTIYREHELEAQRPIYKDETQQNASDKEIIDALEQESLNHTQNDVDWLNARDPRAFTFIDVAASGKNVGCLIKNQQITAAFNDVLYYGGGHYSFREKLSELQAVDGKLQMLNFGTKILIFPYGLYFDTEEPGKGVLPLAFKATASKNLVCTMCTEDRTLHTRLYCGASKPAGAAVGTYVVRSNGDLRIVDEHGALVLLCAAAKWKRQDKDPGVGNYDFWLDTTGTTGSGLKKYSQGTLYRKEDGAWVAEDNVLFSNTWFYTFWLDTTNADAPVYKSYSSTADAWIALPVTYVHIDTAEIEDDVLQSVKAGDTIRLSPDDAFTTEWVNVHSVADDGSWMIVKGMLRGSVASYSRPATIEKVLPEFDFVTVSQNRVWGCKYGKDSAGKHINQIYASKLGDPTNWYCFENTASDSYALSLGDDEPFTGAVSLNDMPYFFKQNKIYGIYGGYPAAYQRIAIEDRGVENDCSGSLAVLNGAVFYKSLDGVCVFDGSTVTNISAALGNTRYTEANAGSSLGKYYISMKNETDGGYETFVYDLNTGLWVRLNGMRYLHFITDYTGSVYAMDPNCIFHELGRHNETALSGLELYKTEDKVEWYAETGAIDFSYPDKKIVSRINLRAKIALGAVLKAFIQYDSSGQWIQMGVLTGNGTPKTEVLNIAR